MAEHWDLLFMLPNLAPPIPTPFASDGYVICSGNDPRLRRLATNAGNETSLKMLKRFSTAQGRRYRPGCFLIRSDIPMASRQAETIRAFRNACALATTTAFYASRLANPTAVQWHVAWSDQFRFGHFLAGHSGWVQTFGGPVTGMDDDIPRQQAAAAFGNPTDFSMVVDEPLLERLFRAWRQCYMQRRNRKKFLRLFRALEVAFHASLFPADGLTSMNDVGNRIASWVSAFEVLCHPGGSVNKRHVQNVISAAQYSEKALTSKRFTVSYGGSKFRATLPEALYDDLYWARNQFLHGMAVRGAMLHYRQSRKYTDLSDVAPVLFNAALVSRLNALGVAGAPMAFKKLTIRTLAPYMKSRSGIERVSQGLVAAGKPGGR
jgi:hypothetical protein